MSSVSSSGASQPNRVRMFASFVHHNYRLFFLGALVSNVGGWMARVAQDWLVLTELTAGSATSLGYVTALQFAPIPLLTPFAGSLADRFDKRKLLIICQAALGLTAFLLWFLVATAQIELWHVYVLAALTGVASAFEMPTRQAFVSEMVPRSLLPNAVGLNSTQFNAARLIGPGVAGLLIAALGVGPALLVNAISFTAVILALWFMRPEELSPTPKVPRKRAVRDGFAYVAHRPDIIVILVVVSSLATFGMNFAITNALMATKEFNRGAAEYGLLGSVMAIGTLGGAFLAARRARPRLRVLLGALLGFSVFNLLAALAPTYEVYAVLLVGVGLCSLTVMISCNATVQLAADPEFRGRVMAVYMAVMMGGTPVGAPIIGWAAEVWGPRAALVIGSIATFIAVIGVSLWIISHDGIRLKLQPAWPPVVIGSGVDEAEEPALPTVRSNRP